MKPDARIEKALLASKVLLRDRGGSVDAIFNVIAAHLRAASPTTMAGSAKVEMALKRGKESGHFCENRHRGIS